MTVIKKNPLFYPWFGEQINYNNRGVLLRERERESPLCNFLFGKRGKFSGMKLVFTKKIKAPNKPYTLICSLGAIWLEISNIVV